MHIQEISQKLNLSKKSIHFYEDKGLIHPKRDQQGYRVYSEEDEKFLLKIKLLRSLGFHIEEIKDILIHHKDLFSKKRKEYEDQLYEVETSIQYLDEVKEAIQNGKDIEQLSLEVHQVFELKNIEGNIDEDIHFEKLSLFFCILAWSFSTHMNENLVYEMISCGSMGIALLIHFSSKVRVFLYQLLSFFKK